MHKKRRNQQEIYLVSVYDSEAFGGNQNVGFLGERQPITEHFGKARKYWTRGGAERLIERIQKGNLSSSYTFLLTAYNRYNYQMRIIN